MNTFLKINKNLAIYTLICLVVIPIFGFKFLISFIGNFLLLLFLIPIMLIIIALISFNSLKTKVITCSQCGSISLGDSNICNNCGSDLGDINMKNYAQVNNPGETTIEIKAEEIK